LFKIGRRQKQKEQQQQQRQKLTFYMCVCGHPEGDMPVTREIFIAAKTISDERGRKA
jgi:hypothetical protein